MAVFEWQILKNGHISADRQKLEILEKIGHITLMFAKSVLFLSILTYYVYRGKNQLFEEEKHWKYP